MIPKPRRALVCSSHTISGVMPGGAMASRHDFFVRAAAAAAAGFDGMCLHLRDYQEQRAGGRSDSQIRGILEDHGLRLTGMEFLTGWDGPDGAALEPEAWRMAQGLAAPVLNIGRAVGAVPRDPSLARARLEALARRAATEGVALALEIVPWTAARDLASAGDLIRDIPNAGLVIDSWHIFRGGIALTDLAQLPGAQILDIQINDALADPAPDPVRDTCNRLCCGEGELDLQGFVRALRQTGTQAPLSVEIISPVLQAMDPTLAARRALQGVERLFQSLDAAAPEGSVTA